MLFKNSLLYAFVVIAGASLLLFYHTKTNYGDHMIDHISLAVHDFQKSVAFYDATLSKLGYERCMTFGEHAAGYGKNKKPYFWVVSGGNENEEIGKARGLHLAFVALSIEDIHAWYEACIAHGGTSNGEPGPRPQYHPGYYAAFIIDPNGWRLEAVLHTYVSKNN